MQIGGERYNIFKQCSGTKTSTIVIRGGAQQFIDEAERSLNDAIMIVRRTMRNTKVVGGGGAIEMEISRFIREYSRSIKGKPQLVMNYFARALEIIPKTLASNSGGDSTEILNQLRQKHQTAGSGSDEGRWMGVDCINCDVTDTFKN